MPGDPMTGTGIPRIGAVRSSRSALMATNSYPLVSVVMPAYNAGAFLAEAIASVLAQTYGNFELIVIDDGSTDESRRIIDEFSDRRLVLLAHASNKGLVESLNDGLRAAKGAYIAIQHAD